MSIRLKCSSLFTEKVMFTSSSCSKMRNNVLFGQRAIFKSKLSYGNRGPGIYCISCIDYLLLLCFYAVAVFNGVFWSLTAVVAMYCHYMEKIVFLYVTKENNRIRVWNNNPVLPPGCHHLQGEEKGKKTQSQNPHTQDTMSLYFGTDHCEPEHPGRRNSNLHL